MSVSWRVLPAALLLAMAGCGSEGSDHAHDDHGHGEESHSHGDDHSHDGGHDHEDNDSHGDHGHGDDHGHGSEGSWSVTAWGEHFEIFAETEPLVAGEPATALVHVTVQRSFRPLADGLVAIVLRKDGGEIVFSEELPVRAGIFEIPIRATEEGIHELAFRVEGAVHSEEIPAGQVRVGTEHAPGGRPPPASGEVVSFRKEQQWQGRFGTAWAEVGEIHRVARGPGRVRPVAGGEVILAAPMNAVVGGEPWPHVGREVSADDRVFELTPHVAADRSLAELQAVATEKRAALGVAEERLKRLESLLPLQAASPAEVDAARGDVTSLRAQLEAAESDLRTARAGRSGGKASGESVPVVSPLSGQVAEVLVRPGQVVGAGEAIGRVVRVEPFWIETYLRPGEAVGLGDGEIGLSVRGPGMSEAISIAAERIRLVSRSPEVDPRNGTVTCIFEVTGSAAPLLGSAVEAEVTLPETIRGVLVPVSSIVDDGGTPIVYEQLDGESFRRVPVEVVARQGPTVVVKGVEAGRRIVTVGGSAIRRADLAASGVGDGHGHGH